MKTFSALISLTFTLWNLTLIAASDASELGIINVSGVKISVVPPGWNEANLSNSELEVSSYKHQGESTHIVLPKDNQGGLASEIFLPPFGSGQGIDDDNDGIIDSEEMKLAQRFAPIIIHDKDDMNLPTSVDWLLQRTSMEYYNNNGFGHRDDHIPCGGRPLNQSSLLGKKGSFHAQEVMSDGTRSLHRQHTFALLDVRTGDRVGSLSTSDWITYVHVFRNYHVGVSIQYWRCYAYNTGDQTMASPVEIDHHGGDWEGVAIILGKDLKPLNYRLLGHTGVESKSTNEVVLEGEHLIVYSEPGGHASHAICRPNDTIPTPVISYRIWLHDLNNDANVIRQETWSGGSVLWPSPAWRSHPGGSRTMSGGLVNVGEKMHPLNGQSFIRYSGLWGSLGSNFSGYWGPAFNETEMASDGLITAWCYSMKASRANVMSLRQECYPSASCD